MSSIDKDKRLVGYAGWMLIQQDSQTKAVMGEIERYAEENDGIISDDLECALSSLSIDRNSLLRGLCGTFRNFAPVIDAIKGEEDFFYPTETDVVLDWTGSLQSEPGET